jgi:hypothetical protein
LFGGGVLLKELSSFIAIILFIIILLVSYGSGLHFQRNFFIFVDKKLELIKSVSYFRGTRKLLKLTQYLTLGLLLVIILQIAPYYYLELWIASMVISFLSSTVIMGLSAYRFLLWYKSAKNFTVLLCCVTFALIAIGSGTRVVVNSSIILSEKDSSYIMSEKIQGSSKGSSLIFSKDQSRALGQFSVSSVPLRLAFLFFWASTVALMHNYSKRLGKVRFWSIMSLPLLSYSIGAYLVAGVYKENLFIGTMIIFASVTLQGILFGIAFFTLARHMKQIHHKEDIGYYLRISGYGSILIAVVLSSPVIDTFSPPFASIAWAFAGLAAYLFGFGFYSTAIYISHDINLRKAIREFAIKETRFLGNIGMAQLEEELKNKISDITNELKKAENYKGVQIPLSEEDTKDYLNLVLDEIKEVKH